MLTGGLFSDSLVEKMEGAPSIVSMLTMSAAMIQGDQYPHRHMNTTFHNNARMAEAKKRISTRIAHNIWSPLPKVDLSPPRLVQTDNGGSVSTVTAAGAKVHVEHALVAAKDNRFKNITEIHQHEYFAEVDFTNLREQKAPFVPELDSETDAGYFDDFSNEADMAKYKEVHDKQRALEEMAERDERMNKNLFVGFTFR